MCRPSPALREGSISRRYRYTGLPRYFLINRRLEEPNLANPRSALIGIPGSYHKPLNDFNSHYSPRFVPWGIFWGDATISHLGRWTRDDWDTTRTAWLGTNVAVSPGQLYGLFVKKTRRVPALRLGGDTDPCCHFFEPASELVWLSEVGHGLSDTANVERGLMVDSQSVGATGSRGDRHPSGWLQRELLRSRPYLANEFPVLNSGRHSSPRLLGQVHDFRPLFVLQEWAGVNRRVQSCLQDLALGGNQDAEDKAATPNDHRSDHTED